jgi:hypothetical protein
METASLDVDVRTDVSARVRIDPAEAGITTGVDLPATEVHGRHERAPPDSAGVFEDADGTVNTAGIDCEAPRLRTAIV